MCVSQREFPPFPVRWVEAVEAPRFVSSTWTKAIRGRSSVLAEYQQIPGKSWGHRPARANSMMGAHFADVDEEQVRHAMADPEIQQILHDPQINMFLKEMQNNPREAQKQMMSDRAAGLLAVSKLVAAGIIRTG
eukprot:symbB.v1.2.002171.t1/scaffold116.1/size325063/28